MELTEFCTFYSSQHNVNAKLVEKCVVKVSEDLGITRKEVIDALLEGTNPKTSQLKVGSFVKVVNQPDSRGKVLEIKKKNAVVWFTLVQRGKSQTKSYSAVTIPLRFLTPLEKEKYAMVNDEIQKEYADPNNKWKSYMIQYKNVLGIRVARGAKSKCVSQTNFDVGDIVDVPFAGKTGLGLIYKRTDKSYYIWMYTGKKSKAYSYKRTDPVKLSKRKNRFTVLDREIERNPNACMMVKNVYQLTKHD